MASGVLALVGGLQVATDGESFCGRHYGVLRRLGVFRRCEIARKKGLLEDETSERKNLS